MQFPAPVPEGLEQWAFAHARFHESLNWAIEQKYGVRFAEKQLYPVNFEDTASVQIFLQQNQEAHNEFGALLGIQGNDLANVDFSDKDQRDQWFFYELQSLRSAAENVGLGI